MSCYAIGDIQGCHVTLCRLLDRVRFDPAQDRLWLTGDLVNRGPRSLEVLRWARRLGDRVTAVLGNHDLHLVGRALGLRPPRKTDTLDPVLEAGDGADLVAWLRERPLLHREGSFVLVHAGLLPEWTVEDAEALAREAEGLLRGDRVKGAFAGEGGDAWSFKLEGARRERAALRVFTRLRMLSPGDGRFSGFSGAPEEAPPGCVPWFEVEHRRGQECTVICGHWAALGFRMLPGLFALDSGCVWGGKLTAVRLEDRAVFQEPMAD